MRMPSTTTTSTSSVRLLPSLVCHTHTHSSIDMASPSSQQQQQQQQQQTSSNGSTVLQLVFDAKYSQNKLLLLEMPDDHAIRTLKRCESITIKGNPDDEAIACTEKQTYLLRQADVSNSMVIVDRNASRSNATEQGGDWVALSSLGSYFELQPTAPRIERLRALLLERPFRGLEHDAKLDDTHGLYTLEQLVASTQASRIETLQAVKEMSAFSINGYMRVLDEDYERELLDMILASIDEVEASLDDAPLADIVDSLPDFAPEAILCCLKKYGTVIDPETQHYKLDQSKLAVFRASELLLRGFEGNPNSEWPLEPFLEAWRRKCPDGVTPSLELLKGLALEEKRGSSSYVKYYPASALPLDAQARFRQLFTLRAKWAQADIQPYLSGIEVTTGMTAEQLLLKYARGSQGPGGVRFYNSREFL